MRRVDVYDVTHAEQTVAADFIEFHESTWGRQDYANWCNAVAEDGRRHAVVRVERKREPVQHWRENGKDLFICMTPKLRELLEAATTDSTVRRMKAEKQEMERQHAQDLRIVRSQLEVSQAHNRDLQNKRFTEIAGFRNLRWYVRVWRALRNKV